MNEDYYNHDLDFPWRLYFNGESMPLWANCWSLCDLLPLAKKLVGERPRFVGYHNISSLHDRMDSAHIVESEDPQVFRITCLTLLALLMRPETEVLQELSAAIERHVPDIADTDAIFQTRPPYAVFFGTTAQSIFDGVRDGLILMHQLAKRDGMAFWSVGYEADGLALNESIRRYRLPLNHPDHVDPPHIQAQRTEISARARSLRRCLIELLRVKHQNKEIRCFIHQLPTSL